MTRLAAAVRNIDSCASEFIVNADDGDAIQSRRPANVVLGGVGGEETAREEAYTRKKLDPVSEEPETYEEDFEEGEGIASTRAGAEPGFGLHLSGAGVHPFTHTGGGTLAGELLKPRPNAVPALPMPTRLPGGAVPEPTTKTLLSDLTKALGQNAQAQAGDDPLTNLPTQ